MSLEVQIIQHEDFVEAIVSGEYDMQEAIDKFPIILSSCQVADLTKILIDFRNLDGKIYAIQKIIYAHHVIDKIRQYFTSRDKNIQFAFVGKPPQISTYEPGIEIVEREGMQAIVTDDINEAFEWLGVKYA